MNQKRRREAPQIPAFRFSGFSGEWEEKVLNTLGRIFIGLVTTMTKHYVSNGVPLIRNSDIKANKILQERLIHLHPDFVEENKNRKLMSGDIVTVHTGDVGISSVVPDELDGCLGFATLNTRLNDKNINPYYLALFFNTENFLNWCQSVSTGDGRSNLNLRDFEKAKVLHPSLEEQTQIGQFFQTIDRLIELQSEKVAQAERYKKAMLQKLFPQKGETIPKLRFVGFSGEWEERTFMEIFNYERPDKYIVSNTEYLSSGTPVLTANKSFVLGYTDEENTYNKGSCIIFDDFTLDSKFVDFPFMVKSSAIKILTTNTGFDLFFSYHRLMTQPIIDEGHARHYISIVQPTKTLVPSFEEQTQIGNFFQILDKRIEAEGQKLDRYQTLKRAMLQRMFV